MPRRPRFGIFISHYCTEVIMKRSLTVSALLVLSLPAAASRPTHPAPLYREGEVIVQFRDGADTVAAEELKQRLGLRSRQRLLNGRAELLALPSAMDVRGAMRALHSEQAVALAQPNYYKRPLAVSPNDPDFAAQWGLNNTGQANFVAGGPAGLPGGDLHLLQAWDPAGDGSFPRTGDGSVTVAVLDDGFQINHPDLSANFLSGRGFTSGGNSSSDVSAVDGHGTQVAGALGAIGNNGTGVAGAIWNVKMLPLKFDYTTSAEVAALQYAADQGASIVNGSFGGPVYDPTELSELQTLGTQGILFVASAGNENSNTDIAGAAYPANYPLANVLAVAATNRQDGIASFSTYGPTTVPVAAPGLQIVTTTTSGGYTTSSGVNGTSFAAPYASGVAALVKNYVPGASAADIKARLIESADVGVDASSPTTDLVAGGRLNAATALSLSPRPALVIAPVTVASYTSSDSGTQVTVPITAAAVVSNDSNGNGLLDPGESADLQIKVQNLWLSAANVTGSLSADDGVTVNSGTVSFGSLGTQSSATGTFNITVPASLSGHQYLNFTLNLSANGGAYTTRRHFTVELGSLVDSSTPITQNIGTGLYDNYQTWHYTLPPGGLPAGTNTLTFQTTASNDIDIIVSYQAPPQYQIDLDAYSDISAIYYYNVPDAQTGAQPGGKEYVNIANPAPGNYYVTVVNYDLTQNAQYQLAAFSSNGGVGNYPSSTVACQYGAGPCAPQDDGGGAIDPLLLGALGLPLAARLRRRRTAPR